MAVEAHLRDEYTQNDLEQFKDDCLRAVSGVAGEENVSLQGSKCRPYDLYVWVDINDLEASFNINQLVRAIEDIGGRGGVARRRDYGLRVQLAKSP